MMGQGKSGWIIAGICGAIVLTSFGYGMGRRAALKSVASSLNVTPAGSPLQAVQIEPIQPQEELAAINANTAGSGPGATAAVETAAVSAPAENAASPAALASNAGSKASASAASAPADEVSRTREVQLALKAAGFDPGSTDGKMGPRTKAAIRDFQQAHGLNGDGRVGPKTWTKLESYLKTAQNSALPQKKQGD